MCILAACAWVLYLDLQVTRQFEGRRWTLPAQVYAAPLELYAGEPLPLPALEQELQRLHYRRADKLESPGTYRWSGEHIDIALRPARFADETRAAQLLTRQRRRRAASCRCATAAVRTCRCCASSRC